MSTSNNHLKTYVGGCHCGAIRYSVEMDLSDGKASKCNCSICLKSNRLSITLDQDRFKLVSPASLTEIPEYQFGTMSQHHRFCAKCGIHCFAYGSYEWEGQTVKNFGINAVTLDPGQGVDLRELKIAYWDGRDGNWAAGAMDKPPAGGCY
ncbi:Mss4-like protein [Lasiosphaeris hirsuta]|uniref:Mss4-like protein n=1 Tax=Lasiosphaeris hirsuta TaxID=260670 RepID=A0AA40A3T5_9PEZI|nr:Mss4-like protein [Lasiosphaeris hirsuta]